jgi:hypothetical protein
MATLTSGVVNATLTDAATYTSASFTPVANDLLIAAYAVTSNTSNDWSASDSLSGTWTKVLTVLKNTSADMMEVFVRDTLVPASAMTVTYSHAGASATGGTWQVTRVAGVTRTGASAIRSSGTQANQASGTTPAPALNQSSLAGNPLITGVNIAASVPGNTIPSGYSIIGSVGHGTPVDGERVVGLAAGSAGTTTITWGSTTSAIYSSFALEIDTSAAVSVAPPSLALLGVG